MRQMTAIGLAIVTSLFTFLSIGAFAEVYKWTVNGKVHYSDRPQIGAKKVKKLKLQKLTIHKAVTVNPANTHYKTEAKRKNISATYKLDIVKPGVEQSFTSSAGNVGLEFSVSPQLNAGAGHTIRYRIDNQAFTEMTDLSATLNNVDRGTHNVFVKVVDNQGIALSSEVSRKFHVHRPSSLILQNLKNTGAAAPNLSQSKPVKGITAPPANPK